MVILVSGATGAHRRFWGEDAFGFLVTPRSGNRPQLAADSGRPWGVDNDAFGGWTAERARNFSRLLGRLCLVADRSRLRFVAAPDCVADWRATLALFVRWGSIIRASGLPVGIVLQDGATEATVPWGQADAVFVGGSTEWKLSAEADRLIAVARERELWVHVGRVNTRCRLRHFLDVGVDSIDGSAFSRWPDKYFGAALRWLREHQRQGRLFSEQGKPGHRAHDAGGKERRHGAAG